MKRIILLALFIPTLVQAQTQVRIGNGVRTADVKDTGSSASLAVAIVDGSGSQVTSFGGGTQYTEADTDASITGAACMWEDTSDTLRAISMAKPLPVQPGTSVTFPISASSLPLPTGAATEATVGAGVWAEDQAVASKFGRLGAFLRKDTPATLTGTDGDAVVQRGTNYGASYVTILDPSGAPAGSGGDASAANQTTIIGHVDGVEAALADISNYAATLNGSLSAEDVAASSSDAGQRSLIVIRQDTPANTAADGDYEFLKQSAGRLWTSSKIDTAIPAGTNNIGDVDVLTLPGVAGDIAHDAADSGNPVKIGMKVETTLPTSAADNDRTNAVGDRFGRQLVAALDPGMQLWKSANYTTTQTGAAIWDPTLDRIGITSIVIGSYATTACRLILWIGANGDSTYSAGTDQLVFAGSFAPSSTSTPGAVLTPPVPVFTQSDDHELHITTSAGCSVDVTVYGFEYDD
jgi:hypothetical protein